MNKIAVFIITISIFCIIPGILFSEETHSENIEETDENASNTDEDFKRNHTFWISSNGAGYFPYSLVLGGNISYQIDYYLFSVRTLVGKDIIEGICENTMGLIWEASPMFGLSFKKRWGYISAATGISLVSGYEIRSGRIYPCDTHVKFYTVGLPIDVRFAFTTPVIGFGVAFFANVNPVETFYGYLFFVDVGWLWNDWNRGRDK